MNAHQRFEEPRLGECLCLAAGGPHRDGPLERRADLRLAVRGTHRSTSAASLRSRAALAAVTTGPSSASQCADATWGCRATIAATTAAIVKTFDIGYSFSLDAHPSGARGEHVIAHSHSTQKRGRGSPRPNRFREDLPRSFGMSRRVEPPVAHVRQDGRRLNEPQEHHRHGPGIEILPDSALTLARSDDIGNPVEYASMVLNTARRRPGRLSHTCSEKTMRGRA